MITLLADANIEGHVERLAVRMQREPFIGFWNDLQMSLVTFADVELVSHDTDALVWKRCQERGLCLITGNRNDDGPDSLESTIRTCNTAECLPVFTIADADRTLADADYAAEVIWTLIDYLLRLDGIKGSGRLYLP